MKEPGRKNTSKSYMWVFLGGARGRPRVIYEYHPGRSGEIVKEFLSGYSGYVQTDGYSAYKHHRRQQRHSAYRLLGACPEEIHGCAMGNGRPAVLTVALSYIRKLYQTETEITDQMKPEQIYELRQKRQSPSCKNSGDGWRTGSNTPHRGDCLA